jgi:DNA-directed RNA polymerase specialized sigma24 family protein
MDRGAFERLLSALDPDRERAGAKYELIRRQLVRLFECRGYPHAEELADQTIDRVARKLAEGEDIRAGDPALYFYGVGRNVLRESWRGAGHERQLVDPGRLAAAGDEGVVADSPTERRLACLEECLNALPADDRDLILWYYQRGERVLIRARQELAARLGIGLNALRLRVHRVRERLGTCARRCLEGISKMDLPPQPQRGE